MRHSALPRRLAATAVAAALGLLLAGSAAAGEDEANVARCDDAVRGSGPPNWKRESERAGSVGVFRHPLRAMSRSANGQLLAKMPIIVEGHRAAIVSVPARLRGRVFLYYGRILDRDGHPTSSFKNATGYARTRFEPCPGRPRTPWPGGIRVKGTAPVHLTVTVEGAAPRYLRLGRPRV
ncbi:MAG: hypothetical protein WD810_00660 [Solirubrobacterales bacterium]